MFVNEKLKEFNEKLKGKRIAVLGIGTSNLPLIEYFSMFGCLISVFDDKEEALIDKPIIDKLKKYNAKYYFGKNSLEKLFGFNYLFRSPSFRPDRPEIVAEVERGAILTSEIEEVLKLAPCKTIGVTGSDGKTTTTSLIYEILKQSGYSCFLGGNIGIPLFTRIKEMKPDDIVVLELSSFQLLNMTISPDIAVVTNITPNHLNIHKDYQEYIDAKKNIFLHQNEEGLLVINYDNEITREFYKDAKGRVVYFSHKQLLDDGVIFDENDRTIKRCEEGVRKHLIKQKNMKLVGVHNCENACAAIGAIGNMVPEDEMVNTIEEFCGVEHRIEFVREIDGVRWYNDSIGSSPTRTIAGLNSFDEKIVLIAGGYDKNLDYGPIADPIIQNVSKLVLMGATADKIEQVVRAKLKTTNINLPIYRCNLLDEVVAKAKEVSVPGEVVLFSPASASFDMFKNFEERGEKFKELVNKL